MFHGEKLTNWPSYVSGQKLLESRRHAILAPCNLSSDLERAHDADLQFIRRE